MTVFWQVGRESFLKEIKVCEHGERWRLGKMGVCPVENPSDNGISQSQGCFLNTKPHSSLSQKFKTIWDTCYAQAWLVSLYGRSWWHLGSGTSCRANREMFQVPPEYRTVLCQAFFTLDSWISQQRSPHVSDSHPVNSSFTWEMLFSGWYSSLSRVFLLDSKHNNPACKQIWPRSCLWPDGIHT